jgi:hypothetical protein
VAPVRLARRTNRSRARPVPGSLRELISSLRD